MTPDHDTPAPVADTPDGTRRGFINHFLGLCAAGACGAVGYPVVRFLNPPAVSEAVQSSVVVGKVDEFPLNSGHLFKFGRHPGLLVRTLDGEFRAFTATCTHLDCTVQFNKEQGDIWCACHNGHYDLNGNNIAGPPPRPLDRYTVTVNENEVIVTRESPTG
jgi:Rieske Fe-S protein